VIVEKLRLQKKMLRYAQSFLRKRLVHTNLQLLYSCNFRCDICDFWKKEYKKRPRLSAEQVEVIADKLAKIGPQIVSIGGGEPLLHPELETVVRVLAKDHFPVMICNGWYMTPKKARDLFAAGIYEVSISVDYADADKHDKQRGLAGAHERALEALACLRDNRVYPWQRVHMISVIMDDNIDDVERLIERCREMGITYLITLYSDSRGQKDPRDVAVDVSSRLLALKERYPEFVVLRGYARNFSRAIRENGIGPCYAGKNLCNIDSTGNVSLCIDHMEDPVGNILEDDIGQIERGLLERFEANSCHSCWTSCRGSIETLMYGERSLENLWDYYQMAKPVPIGQRSFS